MEESQYKTELRNILDENTTKAVVNLNVTLQSLSEKTKSVELLIFPDQDGEGTFEVRVSLSGPDLYILNKAIENSAVLINVILTPNGLKPNVPLVDPFDINFEVNDALSDVVGDWLTSIWNQLNTENFSLPVTIQAVEGYGRNLPIKLN